MRNLLDVSIHFGRRGKRPVEKRHVDTAHDLGIRSKLGANCSVGSSTLHEVLEQMLPAAGGIPLAIQPNAGLPSRIGQLLDMSLRELEKILYFEEYVVLDAKLQGVKKKDLVAVDKARKLFPACRAQYLSSFFWPDIVYKNSKAPLKARPSGELRIHFYVPVYLSAVLFLRREVKDKVERHIF